MKHELVRRFTQDIYMCVYVQPDIAMYGDGDDEYLSLVVGESKRSIIFLLNTIIFIRCCAEGE